MRYPYTALYATLLAFVVLAFSVSDASANSVTNAAPTSDGMLLSAVASADDVWRGWGSQPRCQAQVYVYDETGPEPPHAAMGDMPGCKVYFERRWVRRMRQALARRGYDWRWRRIVLEHVCNVAVHERGHNLGLGHDAGGIMGSVAPRDRVGGCIGWAVEKMPAHPLTSRP